MHVVSPKMTCSIILSYLAFPAASGCFLVKIPECIVRSFLVLVSVDPASLYLIIMHAVYLITGREQVLQALIMTIQLTIQYPRTLAMLCSQFTPFSCLTSYVSLTSSTNHWINILLIHGVQSGDIQIEKVGDICFLLELKLLLLMS